MIGRAFCGTAVGPPIIENRSAQKLAIQGIASNGWRVRQILGSALRSDDKEFRALFRAIDLQYCDRTKGMTECLKLNISC
jgi:hypothetical protein